MALFLLCLTTFAPWAAQGASIDISQATVQAQMEKAFPKEEVYPRGASPARVLVAATFSSPLVTLEGATERVVLCGRWALAIKAALDREDVGRFCAESRLKWNTEGGTVTLSQVRIRSLTLGEDKALPATLLTVLNALVPPMLEGQVVYTAPKLVGWAIKDVKVLDERLRIAF